MKQRFAALQQLAAAPAALPLSLVFPCLNDGDDGVRGLAVDLLSAAGERLQVIADVADLSARLAAIALLGKVGGSKAVLSGLAACEQRTSMGAHRRTGGARRGGSGTGPPGNRTPGHLDAPEHRAEAR